MKVMNLVFALAIALPMCAPALAADTAAPARPGVKAAPPASAPTAGVKPAPKPAAPPAQNPGVPPPAAGNPPVRQLAEHALLKGRVDVKTQNGEKWVLFTVTGGQSRPGKNTDALKGKSLLIVGSRTHEVEKRVGQEISVTGMLKENGTQFDVSAIIETRQPPKLAPGAKPKQKPKFGPRAAVFGKVMVAKDKNKQKTVTITVAQGKGYGDSQGVVLKGKTLTIVGAKVADAERLAGQQVEIIGTLKADNTQIDANSVSNPKGGKAPKGLAQ